ncbi:MAG: LLM class flavin-dependent oxidoreductase [Thermomicrobiales bacterium]|nr:LLM class flavin-dependent oxidoreductase [Thermomicrobiales bacterium]
MLRGLDDVSALAASTKRLRLGLLTGCNTYRDPALHAQMAATVDVISGGRVDFGDGAGWNESEHRSRNIELPGPRQALADAGWRPCRSRRHCGPRRLWTLRVSTTFNGARMSPKPVQKPGPPILIGGSGEQLTLKVVAKHADIWNYSGGDLGDVQAQSGRAKAAL